MLCPLFSIGDEYLVTSKSGIKQKNRRTNKCYIMNEIDLRKDLYIIDVYDGYLVYSPLRRAVFWANEDARDVVNNFLSGHIGLDTKSDSPTLQYLLELNGVKPYMPLQYDITKSTHAVIILSQICNLACSYCYAHNAHNSSIINKEYLKILYDYVLSNTTGRNKQFSFIGGGEPLVTWHMIEWSVDYIKLHKHKEDTVSFSITTNATLFNSQIIDFCKQNRIKLGISFEVLKPVQDTQRPFINRSDSTFDVVHSNIKKLIEKGIELGIRSTITQSNVKLMPEMVHFIANNYPTIRRVHFEQVTDSQQNNESFYNDFITYFFISRNIAKKRGINIYNSITNSVFRIKNSFCGGELCLAPTGSIVACHRQSSKQDKHYEIFKYGEIDKNGLHIDEKKVSQYRDFVSHKPPECKNCYAYWHCAGICPMERMVLSREQLKSKCDFTKEIVKRVLVEKVSNGAKLT